MANTLDCRVRRGQPNGPNRRDLGIGRTETEFDQVQVKVESVQGFAEMSGVQMTCE